MMITILTILTVVVISILSEAPALTPALTPASTSTFSSSFPSEPDGGSSLSKVTNAVLTPTQTSATLIAPNSPSIKTISPACFPAPCFPASCAARQSPPPVVCRGAASVLGADHDYASVASSASSCSSRGFRPATTPTVTSHDVMSHAKKNTDLKVPVGKKLGSAKMGKKTFASPPPEKRKKTTNSLDQRALQGEEVKEALMLHALRVATS
jgi:hypothetical protein